MSQTNISEDFTILSNFIFGKQNFYFFLVGFRNWLHQSCQKYCICKFKTIFFTKINFYFCFKTFLFWKQFCRKRNCVSFVFCLSSHFLILWNSKIFKTETILCRFPEQKGWQHLIIIIELFWSFLTNTNNGQFFLNFCVFPKVCRNKRWQDICSGCVSRVTDRGLL